MHAKVIVRKKGSEPISLTVQMTAAEANLFFSLIDRAGIADRAKDLGLEIGVIYAAAYTAGLRPFVRTAWDGGKTPL